MRLGDPAPQVFLGVESRHGDGTGGVKKQKSGVLQAGKGRA